MLKIPPQKWKFSEFTNYIIKNSNRVFEGPRRRWLKMYYVYMDNNALSTLKQSLSPINQGDLLKFEMIYKESISQKRKHVPYFMANIEPGLCCFFTSSTKEGYQKTLRKRIERTRGMSEMWMRPSIFEKVKDFVVNEYGTKIKGYTSVSSSGDEEEGRLRPHIKRKIHYRGDDAIDTMSELKSWYGVSPISIDFKHKKSHFQITNEGLFTLKNPNEVTFNIVQDVMELIREEQIKQKDIASKLEFKTIENKKSIAVVEAGKIILPSAGLNIESVNLLMERYFANFSFIDTTNLDDSLDFSTTVIDKHKGSIFDVSASENSIVLIPRYEVTYESFLSFYRNVVENFDKKAVLEILR